MRFPLLCLTLVLSAQAQSPLRPPSVPLVTHDPYFSVWSAADALTSENTKHWTGSDQPLSGLARIDGKPFRFIGNGPREAAPMRQTRRNVTPTRTEYGFEAAGIRLSLTFFTPALAHNLDVLSRPVTYVIWEAAATDGATHAVEVYLDGSSALAVNSPEQKTTWSRVRAGDVQALRVGSMQQEMLARSGDNLRIEWGHFYLAVPNESGADLVAGTPRTRSEFLRAGKLPAADELEPGQRFSLAAAWSVPKLGATVIARWAMLAYDDQYSIQYFQRNLRPWWRRNGMGIAELLQTAAREFPDLSAAGRKFDEEFTKDLVRTGGDQFAAIAVLAYRQAIAAHKLVADLDGTPLYFSKENFSNGCIGTVDVTYPSAPLFLLLNPKLHMALIRPVLDYAMLPRWKWPFAPHDLGQYPLANGQVYGGGERTEENQMPVEESGNMLILVLAQAQAEGNAEFARRYWPVLTKWADYLKAKGLDPDNQLSTDDFAGHLAHNTNLSIKAIVALGAYAKLAEMLGDAQNASKTRQNASEMAQKWPQMALDGDHFKLAFDKPGTWSQKYNLVWDQVLGLKLFDPAIARKEIAYYKTKQNKYGLPLDNRETYTKLDWIVWTATMAENHADFLALIEPVYRFLNESPSRVPMTDWYWTIDGKQRGFQARSVVGGVFMPMLAQPAMWEKWRVR
jgi:hypothetical protein